MRISALLSLGLLVLSTQAFAADPAKPAPLENLEKQGAAVRYLGKDAGLDGWVAIRNGQEQYFYVTPDLQGIISGVLFNNKGDMVTMRQIAELRAKDPSVDKLADPSQSLDAGEEVSAPTTTTSAPVDPSKAVPSKAAQLYADVEAANWIAVGQKTAPIIYSFIDPQCPHCHDMVNDVRKSGFLEKGQLQLRLVPVGLMNEQSLKQAANLLTVPNPAAALFKHMDGDATALMVDKDPNTQAIQKNMVLMQNWKLDVTPFSIYKSKTGEIKILRGRPRDLKNLVADLK